MRELTIRPGGVVRDYLDGRRVHFVNPLRYAVVTCGLWWLVLQWVIAGADLTKVGPGMRTLLRHGNWINLVLLPVLALPIWLAFVRERFGYVEHLCFLLFTAGHAFLWRTGLALLGAFNAQWGSVLNQVDQCVFLAYTLLALVFCHWRRARWVLVRSVLALAGFLLASHYSGPLLARWLTN